VEEKGRLSSAAYLEALARYKRTLKRYREDHPIKDFMVMGIKQSTVSSWFSEDRPKAVPDVIVGAALAKTFGDTVENAVLGDPPRFHHKSEAIKEIVERLSPLSDDDDFMKEIRGIVKSYIFRYTEDQRERAVSGE
jgi:hypothetical protein